MVIRTIGFLIIIVLVLMFVLRTKELSLDQQLNQSYQEVDTVPMRQSQPLFDIDYHEVIFVPPYVSYKSFDKLEGYYWNLLMPYRIFLHSLNESYVIALFVRNKWVFAFAKVPNQPIDFGALWDTNGVLALCRSAKMNLKRCIIRK